MKKVPAASLAALAALLALPRLAVAAEPPALTSASVQQVVDTFAGNAVETGRAVGVAVGVYTPTTPFLGYAFGYADAAGKTPLATDTLFEIASNTKVFTTNLLGQAVVGKTLALSTSLKQLSAQVGVLKPLSGQVTLEELGDFTAGFPDLAPLCKHSAVRGCLPDERPSETDYTAADFLTFFRNTVPTNYTGATPVALSTLPGPYFYSNFSVGLLGLILATPEGPIGSGAVDAWYADVKSRILSPLGMTRTYLTVPATVPASQVAAGYSPATATATVSAGRISGITVTNGGGAYAAAPGVSVIGGGGAGAKAAALVANGEVTGITVRSAGERYLAPPSIIFNGGGSTTTAHAAAIVSDGKIVGLDLIDTGAGYVRAPRVTISGGRSASGRDAAAVAHIADGRVTAVTVTSGGSGYVTPLSVVVAPGSAEANVVPVWAPAGALISSITDMTRFAAAALGETTLGTRHVPSAVTGGFTLAETAYACTVGPARLSTCPAAADRIGLAWVVRPADTANGVPEIVTKNGALPGFSSQVLLIPAKHIAVVVLVNSDDRAPAERLAFEIAYGLLYPPAP